MRAVRVMSESKIAIQRVTQKDLEQLAGLYEELMGCKIDLKKLREKFNEIDNNKNYILIVAKDGGKVIGSATGIVCQDLTGGCPRHMVVDNVIVSMHYRGRGIGKYLMNKMEEEAEKLGCEYVLLASATEKHRVQSFYESIGYIGNVATGLKKYL